MSKSSITFFRIGKALHISFLQFEDVNFAECIVKTHDFSSFLNYPIRITLTQGTKIFLSDMNLLIFRAAPSGDLYHMDQQAYECFPHNIGNPLLF